MSAWSVTKEKDTTYDRATDETVRLVRIEKVSRWREVGRYRGRAVSTFDPDNPPLMASTGSTGALGEFAFIRCTDCGEVTRVYAREAQSLALVHRGSKRLHRLVRTDLP